MAGSWQPATYQPLAMSYELLAISNNFKILPFGFAKSLTNETFIPTGSALISFYLHDKSFVHKEKNISPNSPVSFYIISEIYVSDSNLLCQPAHSPTVTHL